MTIAYDNGNVTFITAARNPLRRRRLAKKRYRYSIRPPLCRIPPTLCSTIGSKGSNAPSQGVPAMFDMVGIKRETGASSRVCAATKPVLPPQR